MLEQGLSSVCKEGRVLPAMLTLCPPEKSSAVRLGEKHTELRAPPKSESKRFDFEPNPIYFLLPFYERATP